MGRISTRVGFSTEFCNFSDDSGYAPELYREELDICFVHLLFFCGISFDTIINISQILRQETEHNRKPNDSFRLDVQHINYRFWIGEKVFWDLLIDGH